MRLEEDGTIRPFDFRCKRPKETSCTRLTLNRGSQSRKDALNLLPPRRHRSGGTKTPKTTNHSRSTCLQTGGVPWRTKTTEGPIKSKIQHRQTTKTTQKLGPSLDDVPVEGLNRRSRDYRLLCFRGLHRSRRTSRTPTESQSKRAER